VITGLKLWAGILKLFQFCIFFASILVEGHSEQSCSSPRSRARPADYVKDGTIYFDLTKSVNGLTESAALRYREVCDVLIWLGYIQHMADPCIFIHPELCSALYVVLRSIHSEECAWKVHTEYVFSLLMARNRQKRKRVFSVPQSAHLKVDRAEHNLPTAHTRITGQSAKLFTAEEPKLAAINIYVDDCLISCDGYIVSAQLTAFFNTYGSTSTVKTGELTFLGMYFFRRNDGVVQVSMSKFLTSLARENAVLAYCTLSRHFRSTAQSLRKRTFVA
jgi:hypothetical protein